MDIDNSNEDPTEELFVNAFSQQSSSSDLSNKNKRKQNNNNNNNNKTKRKDELVEKVIIKHTYAVVDNIDNTTYVGNSCRYH